MALVSKAPDQIQKRLRAVYDAGVDSGCFLRVFQRRLSGSDSCSPLPLGLCPLGPSLLHGSFLEIRIASVEHVHGLDADLQELHGAVQQPGEVTGDMPLVILQGSPLVR
jgi:hypothetical protein